MNLNMQRDEAFFKFKFFVKLEKFSVGNVFTDQNHPAMSYEFKDEVVSMSGRINLILVVRRGEAKLHYCY